MFQRKMSVKSCGGQILTEALLASLLMITIMLAFNKLIELKRTRAIEMREIKERVTKQNDEIFKL